MKIKACDKCNVYLPSNLLRLVWVKKKDRHLWLCKSCAIDLCVDAEYINSYDDED